MIITTESAYAGSGRMAEQQAQGYAIILPWFHSHGLDLRLLVALPFSSRPAAMFSIDVLMSATVFLIWADVECRRLGMAGRWRPLAAVFLAGLCFALPLFLARREAAITRSGGSGMRTPRRT